MHTILLILLLGAGIARAQQTNVRETLDQMSQVERQMDQLRKSQWEERTRLLETKKSLGSIEKRINDRTALRREGEQFLKQYQDQAGREAAQIDKQMEDDLVRMRAARRGLALTGAAMLRASTSDAIDDADRVALALLWRDRQQAASISAQRLLRLESQRAQIISGRAEAGEVAQQHSAFSSLSEQELSEKHKQLAGQVAALQGNIGESEQELKTLAARREELRGLMAKLVEAETKTEATPAPTPSPAPMKPASTPVPEKQIATAAPQAAGENGDQPLVSKDNVAPESDDGTRQLFWRAEPIGVRALGSGRVVFAEPFAGYRNLMIIDHGGGWRTLYGNLTRCALKTGAQVAVGDTIGEYQSSQEGSRAEPFWIEVRQGVTAMKPDQWPALPTQWEHNLFAPIASPAK